MVILTTWALFKGYPTQMRSCEAPFVLCRDGKLCISNTKLCDGKFDCPDGFDEESCIKSCPKRGTKT